MATFREGDMLAHLGECDFAYLTTNSIVKKDGRLVMGRGIAQQARDKYKDLDKAFGKAILERKSHFKEYSLLENEEYPQLRGFQVKLGWWEEACMDLITNSTNELSTYAVNHKDEILFLNFPGVGNGKLSMEDVMPIVEQLPSNVVVWSF